MQKNYVIFSRVEQFHKHYWFILQNNKHISISIDMKKINIFENVKNVKYVQ